MSRDELVLVVRAGGLVLRLVAVAAAVGFDAEAQPASAGLDHHAQTLDLSPGTEGSAEVVAVNARLVSSRL